LDIAGLQQRAEASANAQQAAQQSGIQLNTFVSPAQARSLASSAPPIVAPQRKMEPKFQDRDDILDYADLIINSIASGANDEVPRVILLHGIGGVGKTTALKEIAHRAIDVDVTAWWVQAANPERMEAAFHAIAFAVGAIEADFAHAHPTDVMWKHLEGATQPWMLIIDGADEPQLLTAGNVPLADGTGWLRPPSTRYGAVIVSTRDGRKERWAPWATMLPISCLDPTSGAQILIDLAPRGGTAVAARRLSATLGGLPLALELAGRSLAATMNAIFPTSEPISSFTAYDSTLTRRALEITDMTNEGSTEGRQRGRALSTTWEISLEQLTTQGYDLARPLIRLISCCAPAPLPYQSILNSEILGISPLFTDPTPQRIDSSLRALAGIGLLDLNVSSGRKEERVATLRMHPVVHSITRQNTLASGDFPAYRILIVQLLDACTIELNADDSDNWRPWSMLAEHAFSMLDLTSEEIPMDANGVRLALAPARRAARYRYMAGIYTQAASAFRSVLAIARTSFGDRDADTLDIRSNLALNYQRGRQSRRCTR
jgi:hypothetical protein